MDFTKDIYINKEIISENSEIVLLYKGFLFSNNLTNEVYISYGYGNLWNNKQEIKMKPSTFGYLATINIENGENLQFCFKNDRGTWDNNNGQNYILPIQESEEVLSFKTLPNTEKEIDLELDTITSTTNTENNETENILEASVISSNNVDFYQTINLENITKQVIPNSTTFTKITTNENTENIVSNSVIKSDEVKETTSVTFSELTEKAKKDLFFEVIFMTYSYVHTKINEEAFPNAINLYNKVLMTGRGKGKYMYKNQYREDGEEFFREQMKKYFPNNEIMYIV